MNRDRPIVVAGAGAIGCFVGGLLAADGRRVALLLRPRVKVEIERYGLRLTDFGGADRTIAPGRLALSEDPAILHSAGIVLVTVKSADTAAVADQIARHAPQDAVIVSLQNGVDNVARLRAQLGGRRMLAGMVPFNVVAMGEGRFHRSTSGDIQIAADADDTAASLSVPGLPVRSSRDITGVQWGKLIINLNNALSALSDMPLAAQLARRDWRRLFADQMAEGLAVLRAAGIAPVTPTPIPLAWTPALVSVMAANNETGALQPVAEAAGLVRQAGGLLHVDAIQALGKIPFDIKAMGADLVSLSGHKVGAPKGVGALVIAEGLTGLDPVLRGGGQELNRRAGTENVPGIAAFGAAVKAALQALPQDAARMTSLRDHLEKGLRASCGVTIFSDDVPRLPNTTLFTAPGLKAETAVIGFDLEGVAVSSGSACSSGKVQPSHVLSAMGYDPAAAQGAVRLSLGWTTDPEDINRALEAWRKLAHHLLKA